MRKFNILISLLFAAALFGTPAMAAETTKQEAGKLEQIDNTPKGKVDCPMHEGNKKYPMHEGVKDCPMHEVKKDCPMHEGKKECPLHQAKKDCPVHEGQKECQHKNGEPCEYKQNARKHNKPHEQCDYKKQG